QEFVQRRQLDQRRPAGLCAQSGQGDRRDPRAQVAPRPRVSDLRTARTPSLLVLLSSDGGGKSSIRGEKRNFRRAMIPIWMELTVGSQNCRLSRFTPGQLRDTGDGVCARRYIEAMRGRPGAEGHSAE